MCTPIEMRIPEILPGQEQLLTKETLAFVAQLHQVAAGRRFELLRERREAGASADVAPLPESIRASVADLGADARADWRTVMTGQLVLRETIDGLGSGDEQLIRPRELHVDEIHLWLHGRPLVAGIVDVGLYLVANAPTMLARGIRPTVLLTDVRTQEEARLWHDVLTRAEDLLGRPRGTVAVSTYGCDTPACAFLEEVRGEQHAMAAA